MSFGGGIAMCHKFEHSTSTHFHMNWGWGGDERRCVLEWELANW